MTIFIYYLLDPLTGKIRYVGKTYDPQHRFGAHLRDKGKSRKSNWIKSLISKRSKPVMEILEEVEDDDDTKWQDSERFWIALFKSCGASLLNHDNGGLSGKMMSEETKQKLRISSTGRKLSPEAIEKMKASKRASMTDELRFGLANRLRGKPVPQWVIDKRNLKLVGQKRTEKFKQSQRERATGKTHTLETKQKIRDLKLGQKASEETRQKMIAAKLGKKRGPYKMNPNHVHKNLGRKASEETRQKLSASHFGLKQSEETKAKKRASALAFLARKRAALMACEI